MSKEAFDKFHGRYCKEREEILEQLQNSAPIISNLSDTISKALKLSSKLATVWTSSDLKVVEGLQKLIFPEGIYYNKKNRSFRTPNEFHFLIHCPPTAAFSRKCKRDKPYS